MRITVYILMYSKVGCAKNYLLRINLERRRGHENSKEEVGRPCSMPFPQSERHLGFQDVPRVRIEYLGRACTWIVSRRSSRGVAERKNRASVWWRRLAFYAACICTYSELPGCKVILYRVHPVLSNYGNFNKSFTSLIWAEYCWNVWLPQKVRMSKNTIFYHQLGKILILFNLA